MSKLTDACYRDALQPLNGVRHQAGP